MNSEIAEYINKNYDKYLRIAYGYNKDKTEDPRDILQECLMYVCEMDIEKQNKIAPYFEYYLIQMIKFSSISKTSKYQQKYNKILLNKNIEVESVNDLDKMICDDEIENDLKINKIKEILEKDCTWYEREVFLQYVTTGKSFKAFERDTKIPASSLFNTYRNVKEKIKEKIELWHDQKK